MRNKIEQAWNSFTPEKKKKVVMLLLAGSLIIIGVIGYKLSRPSVPVHQSPAETRRELTLETGILERSAYMESQRQLEKLRGQVDELRKLKEQEAAAGAAAGDIGINQNEASQMPQGFPPIPQGAPPFPQGVPPPPQGGNVAFPSPVQHGQLPVEQQPPPPPVIMGGISVVSGNVVEKDKKEDEDKKKGRETIYLPPSFMEATLLSGLNAPAVGDGRENPVPVLMRVKNIAVLPNRVRANLKGCFVIADGTGSLADERAHLRLVSLSCIARNGQSVIDQRIKGFVIDSDGKIGLSGRVVSKMGSTIARSFLAGMFGGFGTAVQAAKTPTAISPLGVTHAPANQIGDIAAAGLAGGLATAATEIQNFYLELARQSVPVIEVGAAKTVTLVISEGVELEIKDFRTLEGGSK